MTYTRGNKALGEHRNQGRELHVFRSDGGGVVTYFGQYLCEDDFEETLPDKHGDDRTAIRFKLRPVDEDEDDSGEGSRAGGMVSGRLVVLQ